MNEKPQIQTLLTGKIQPLAQTEFISGIRKIPVNSAQQVTKTGLVEDAQADLRFHGGTEKALHQYAWEHYAIWKENSENPIFNAPGAFGENISSTGMTEETVCIGDRYKAGSCILEVSQARQPCWKLNYHFDFPDMAKTVQNTMKTGWYYRILQTGTLKTGDTLELLERPFPKWNLHKLLTLLYKNTLDMALLKEALEIQPLAESWKKIFRNRIETEQVENWQHRLYK